MKQLLKKTMIAALFVTFVSTAYSQSFTIANTAASREFFIGLEHPISGFVEGYKSKDIFLVADKGKLSKQEGMYSFQSDTLGIVNISIYVKKGNISKKIGSSTFAVIEWPYPVVAMIGGKWNNDTMSKKKLVAQEGVSARLTGPIAHYGSYKVSSFNVAILKKDSTVSKIFYNEGNAFTKETRAFISTIEPGDQLLVYSILARTFYSNKISVVPLLLNIAE